MNADNAATRQATHYVLPPTAETVHWGYFSRSLKPVPSVPSGGGAGRALERGNLFRQLSALTAGTVQAADKGVARHMRLCRRLPRPARRRIGA
jgi:hypothetical protein